MSFFVKVLRTGGCNLGESVGYVEHLEVVEIGVSPHTEAVLAMITHGDLALCQENGDLIGPPVLNTTDRQPFSKDPIAGPGHSTTFLQPQGNR